MRLDALIATLDHLSSTQLYTLIVVATVGICLIVLGTGSHEDDPVVQPSVSNPVKLVKASIGSSGATSGAAAAASNNATGTSSTSTRTTGRQPRFWIFKYVNVAVSLLFLASILQFALNAPDYMEHLNTFLLGWSVLLCYFFGFFGVSLIHTDLLVEGGDTA
jgi:hypothetical protein